MVEKRRARAEVHIIRSAQPCVAFLGVQDHRHPGMQVGGRVVGGAGQDGAGQQVVPAGRQTSEEQRRLVGCRIDEVGLLGAPVARPLVIARRWYQAPAIASHGAEGRFALRLFDPGIEGRRLPALNVVALEP